MKKIFLTWLLSFAAAAQIFTVTSPQERSVYQRVSGQATVSISGTTTGTVTSIQARALPLGGYTSGGTLVDWFALTTHTDGSFSGSVTATTGSYYLELRAYNGPNALGCSATQVNFFVGDIFISCGQSTSVNFGQTATTVNDARISMRSLSLPWAIANDPQLNDGPAPGTAGSPWPSFANTLIAHNGVPVGMLEAGIGNTQISQWLPTDASAYYTTWLKPVLLLYPNSYVLWQQGENDCGLGTSQATYTADLRTIISQSRTDTGTNIKWGIAQTSYQGGTTCSAITSAQAAVAADTNNFLGPNTDSIPSAGRFDGTHMNIGGLGTNGQLWEAAVVSGLGL